MKGVTGKAYLAVLLLTFSSIGLGLGGFVGSVEAQVHGVADIVFDCDGTEEEPNGTACSTAEAVDDGDTGDAGDGYALFIEPEAAVVSSDAAVVIQPTEADTFNFTFYAEAYGSDESASDVSIDDGTPVSFALVKPGLLAGPFNPTRPIVAQCDENPDACAFAEDGSVGDGTFSEVDGAESVRVSIPESAVADGVYAAWAFIRVDDSRDWLGATEIQPVSGYHSALKNTLRGEAPGALLDALDYHFTPVVAVDEASNLVPCNGTCDQNDGWFHVITPQNAESIDDGQQVIVRPDDDGTYVFTQEVFAINSGNGEFQRLPLNEEFGGVKRTYLSFNTVSKAAENVDQLDVEGIGHVFSISDGELQDDDLRKEYRVSFDTFKEHGMDVSDPVEGEALILEPTAIWSGVWYSPNQAPGPDTRLGWDEANADACEDAPENGDAIAEKCPESGGFFNLIKNELVGEEGDDGQEMKNVGGFIDVPDLFEYVITPVTASPAEATGDGLVASYVLPDPIKSPLGAPVIALEDTQNVTVRVRERDDAGTYQPFAGPLDLVIQRNCGFLKETLETGGTINCHEDMENVYNATQNFVDGKATFNITREQLAEAFEGSDACEGPCPLAALNFFVHQNPAGGVERHSSYSVETNVLMAAAEAASDNTAFGIADAVDDEHLFTPVILLNDPNTLAPGDGFVARTTITGSVPVPEGVLVLPGEDGTFQVTADMWAAGGDGVYAPADSRIASVIFQWLDTGDCGPGTLIDDICSLSFGGAAGSGGHYEWTIDVDDLPQFDEMLATGNGFDVIVFYRTEAADPGRTSHHFAATNLVLSGAGDGAGESDQALQLADALEGPEQDVTQPFTPVFFVEDVDTGDAGDGYALFIEPDGAVASSEQAVAIEPTDEETFDFTFYAEQYGGDSVDRVNVTLDTPVAFALLNQEFLETFNATESITKQCAENEGACVFAADGSANTVENFTLGDNSVKVSVPAGDVPPGAYVAWAFIEADASRGWLGVTDVQPVSGYHSVLRNALAGTQAADFLDYHFTPVLLEDARSTVSISPESDRINEGGEATYSVTLNKAPVGVVRVDVFVGNSSSADIAITSEEATADLDGDGTLTLVFTPETYDEPQNVTVSAIRDEVEDDLAVETHFVNHTVTAPLDPEFETAEGEVLSYQVDVVDLDRFQFFLECTGEGNDPEATEDDPSNKAVCTVTLGEQPEDANGNPIPVVVDILEESLDGRAMSNKDFLLFGNDFNPKSFELTGVDDDVFNANQSITVEAVASSQSDLYDTKTANGTFVVLDDELPSIEVVEAPAYPDHNTTEGDALDNATYALRFAQEPHAGQSAVVTFTATDGRTSVAGTSVDRVTISDTTGVVIDVSAIDDAIDQGATYDGTITHATTAKIIGAIADFGFIVTDNDDSGILAVDAFGENAAEGGATGNFTVELTSKPTGTVTYDLSADADGNVSPSTVTFNATNWNVTQNVTVAAVDDDHIEGLHSTTITFAVDADATQDAIYDAIANSTFLFDVVDDDVAGIRIDSGGAVDLNVTVNEAGPNATYTVATATSIPDGSEVVVDITHDGGNNFDVTPSTVTFNHTFTSATVTVVPGDDETVEGTVDYNLDHTINTGATTYAPYDAVAMITANLSVIDDDVAEVVVDVSDAALNEGEADGGGFTVVLSTDPTEANSSAEVMVTLQTDNGLVASPNQLVFGNANWSTPQSVSVTSVDDEIDQGIDYTRDIAFTTSVSGGIPEVNPADNVTFTVTDDDGAGFDLNVPTEFNVTEGESGDVFQVELSSEPTGDVFLNVTGDDNATATPAVLVFNATNWNITQAVTVTAVDDPNIEESVHAASVLLSIDTNRTIDAQYALVTDSSVDVAVNDDDVAGILTDEGALFEVRESDDGKVFNVNLTARPIHPVTINITVDEGEGQVTYDTDPTVEGDQHQLIIEPDNWSVAHPVNVTAVDDTLAGIDETDEVVLNLTATSDDTLFGGLFRLVDILVDDNDVGVVLSTTSVEVLEGGEPAMYRVNLTNDLDEAEAFVVVTVTVDADDMTGPDGNVDAECGGLRLEVGADAPTAGDSGCSVDLVFEPGHHVEGDGTGFDHQTIRVYAPEDDHIDLLDVDITSGETPDPLDKNRPVTIMHTPFSADPDYSSVGAEDRNVVVTRTDNDPTCPAELQEELEGSTGLNCVDDDGDSVPDSVPQAVNDTRNDVAGDGVFALFADDALVASDNGTVTVAAELFTRGDSDWSQVSGGTATFFLEPDCGELDSTECSSLHGEGVRIRAQGGESDGVFSATFSSEDVESILLEGNVTFVNMFVAHPAFDGSESHHNAASKTLWQTGVLEAQDAADALEDESFTPVLLAAVGLDTDGAVCGAAAAENDTAAECVEEVADGVVDDEDGDGIPNEVDDNGLVGVYATLSATCGLPVGVCESPFDGDYYLMLPIGPQKLPGQEEES